MEHSTTMAKYRLVIFFPNTFRSTKREAMLVTGPVNRNTKAPPRDKPLVIRDKAMGMEAVEQIYMGSPTKTMDSMAKIPWLIPIFTKKSAGKKAEIKEASTIPVRKCTEISSKNSQKA